MFISNLLGAAALAVGDRVETLAATKVGVSPQVGAAIVLIAMRPGQSIRRLATSLRLSHSATVRLVDGLSRRGWVLRTDAADKRVVKLSLSDVGEAVHARLLDARSAVLAPLLAGMDAGQLAHLRQGLEAILANATEDMTDAYANCRLCDVAACEAEGCPVEAKARTLWKDRRLQPATKGDER